MGTAFTSTNLNSNKDCVSSTFSKTVCLQDWWLVRSEREFEGKRLAVAGLTAERPMRLFSSAPITKRHDLFTLETADGITVLIKGSVNRSRMHTNGFHSEVCNHFLLGFPYYWEDFADQSFDKDSNNCGFSPTSSGPSNKQENREHNSFEEHKQSMQRGEFEEKSETIRGDFSKDFTMQLKERTLSSCDIERHIAEKFSNEDKVVETRSPLSASKMTSKDLSCERMRIQNNDTFKDHFLSLNSNLKNVSLSKVDKSIEKYSRARMRSLKMVENLSNKIKSTGSSSRRPIVCSLVTSECANNLGTPDEKKFHMADSSSLSNVNIEGVAKKSYWTSPEDRSPKCLANLRKCSSDTGNADTSRDPSMVVGSDNNDINPSDFNKVVPMKTSFNYLESSSRELRSSKNYKKGKNKTCSGFEAEQLTSLRTFGYDIMNDGSLKDALALVESNSKLSGTSEINGATTSSHHPITSSGKLEGLNRERKNVAIADKCVSQENEPMVVGTSEQDLHHDNEECLSDVGFDVVVDEFLSVAPGHPENLERSGNCTLTTNTLKNLENKRGKNLTSECVLKNGNGEPVVMSLAVEKPAAKHRAGRSASNEGKRGMAVEVVSSFEPRRSSRLKGLKYINNMETERNKVNSVSFGSNVIKSAADIMNSSKSGCGAALDFSSIQSQRTICKSSAKEEKVGSVHGSLTNSLSCSTPTEAIQKQNSGSDMNATESSEQTEPCRSSIRLDEVNCKSNLKISVEGKDSHNTESGISQKRTKRKLKYATDVVTPMPSRSRGKKITSVSPESLSYKRSRSGRLLVPPLDFWRNQQVVYDMDGEITGISPVVKSHEGSRSETLRKKKKFMSRTTIHL